MQGGLEIQISCEEVVIESYQEAVHEKFEDVAASILARLKEDPDSLYSGVDLNV